MLQERLFFDLDNDSILHFFNQWDLLCFSTNVFLRSCKTVLSLAWFIHSHWQMAISDQASKRPSLGVSVTSPILHPDYSRLARRRDTRSAEHGYSSSHQIGTPRTIAIAEHPGEDLDRNENEAAYQLEA